MVMATAEGLGKSLITGEPWDCFRLESLLALKEVYRENTEFGFLLRHYWIPATVLQFRQSSRTVFPDGAVEQSDQAIERKMARCRSNECLWREKTRVLAAENGNGAESALSEELCSYDCYEQTFWSARPVLFNGPTAEARPLARRQALYRLPILVPPGPVPLGFCWYAKVDDDYMNYRLDAEERIGETSVLVIRREGRYTRWLSGAEGCYGRGLAAAATGAADGGTTGLPVVTQRQGVTLFAWNRGVVLEDRLLDFVVDASGCLASCAGMTTQIVTRLIRSIPDNSTEPASFPDRKQPR